MLNDEAMPRQGPVDEWEAKQALETLKEAAKIEASPRMMRAVGEAADKDAHEASRASQRFGKGGVVGNVAPHKDATREGRQKF